MKYCNDLSKIELANNVSSLYKMNYACGATNIWIKRDDLLDFAFGGNKVRLFEYIGPLIIKSEAKRLVTYGSRYSNHIRVAAAMASYLGIENDIIILDDHIKNDFGGNFALLNYFNPRIIYCSPNNAHKFIDEYQSELIKQNINYIWIPGGGHIPEAAFAYADASLEIKDQSYSLGVNIDAVFLPCGTGTTQAGLIYGFADTDTQIIGISISRSPERCKKEITDTLKEMNSIYINKATSKKSINVLEKISSYGEHDPISNKTIIDVANSDGIFLDPIYNAKAFAVMHNYLIEHKELKNVVYINTGGTPNIFAGGETC